MQRYKNFKVLPNYFSKKARKKARTLKHTPSVSNLRSQFLFCYPLYRKLLKVYNNIIYILYYYKNIINNIFVFILSIHTPMHFFNWDLRSETDIVSIISLTTIFWGENFVVLGFFKPVKSLQKVSKRWSFPTQRALLCPKLARGVREIIQRPVGDFPLPFALVPWGQYLSYTNLSGRIWIIPACPRCLSPWLFGAHDCSPWLLR